MPVQPFRFKPSHPFTTFFIIELFVAMALEMLRTLDAVFDKADTPDSLRTWLTQTLEMKRISDLVDYVDSLSEWRNLVVGAFPVVPLQAAQDAVPAQDDVAARPARPAIEGFPEGKQRILIGRMRTTYKVALGVEQDEKETSRAAKQVAFTTDLELPLDPETRKRLKTSWNTIHPWQPVASMKAGPKFRNRVVREFLGHCVTNHTVEKCVSSLQANDRSNQIACKWALPPQWLP